MSICACMLREHDTVWWQPTLWLPRLVLTAASWWLPQTVDLCVMCLCVCACLSLPLSMQLSLGVGVCTSVCVCARAHVFRAWCDIVCGGGVQVLFLFVCVRCVGVSFRLTCALVCVCVCVCVCPWCLIVCLCVLACVCAGGRQMCLQRSRVLGAQASVAISGPVSCARKKYNSVCVS